MFQFSLFVFCFPSPSMRYIIKNISKLLLHFSWNLEQSIHKTISMCVLIFNYLHRVVLVFVCDRVVKYYDSFGNSYELTDTLTDKQAKLKWVLQNDGNFFVIIYRFSFLFVFSSLLNTYKWHVKIDLANLLG